jgi:ABC-type polysaccharide/polyol phosphate transport system ATPase subunit
MSADILQVCNLSKSFNQTIGQGDFGKIGWQAMWRALSWNRKKCHQQSFDAISELNFTLPRGESLGIIGLNGSGKSTLLQIIVGTLQPTSGTIKTNGRITALLELGSGFNPEFSGIENIFLTGSLYDLSKNEINQRLQNIIDFADIGDHITQPLKTYSSGMNLRLAFAVASNLDADILVIDEALAVGDARFQMKCFSFLERFKERGGTLILVSHDLNSIAKLCDRSILLHHGRLVCQGRSINVINEYSKIISDRSSEKTEKINSSSEENPQQSIFNESDDGIKQISYGGTLGKIRNVMINDAKSAIIRSGNEFSITFDILSLSRIAKPIFALRIRDVKGQEIYGTNTKFQNLNTPNLEKGDCLTVKFTQEANLGIGKYLVSIGFTFYENDELQVVHRLRECLEFEIFNQNESFGISNCFSRILLSDLKSSDE